MNHRSNRLREAFVRFFKIPYNFNALLLGVENRRVGPAFAL
jgi:hypothetical protein